MICECHDPVAAYLTARMRARRERRDPRCWGVSSDALVLYALGEGPRPQTPGTPDTPAGRGWTGEECGRDYPHDEGDLRACELSYAFAPSELAERMLPVLREFRAWVRYGVNRHGVKIQGTVTER